MQASTHQPRAHRGAKAKAAHVLPYPDLGPIGGKLFWLAAYLRDLAEMVALQHHVRELEKKPSSPGVLLFSLYGCGGDVQERVNLSAIYALQEGLLLFAHPDTTVFMQTGGAA